MNAMQIYRFIDRDRPQLMGHSISDMDDDEYDDAIGYAVLGDNDYVPSYKTVTERPKKPDISDFEGDMDSYENAMKIYFNNMILYYDYINDQKARKPGIEFYLHSLMPKVKPPVKPDMADFEDLSKYNQAVSTYRLELKNYGDYLDNETKELSDFLKRLFPKGLDFPEFEEEDEYVDTAIKKTKELYPKKPTKIPSFDTSTVLLIGLGILGFYLLTQK